MIFRFASKYEEKAEACQNVDDDLRLGQILQRNDIYGPLLFIVDVFARVLVDAALVQ